MSEGARVLLVDVDEGPLAAVADALRARGFVVDSASSVPAACEIAREGVDAVVATRRIVEDDSSGLGLVDAMTLDTPSPPPFVIWGNEWSVDSAQEIDDKLRALLPHVARAALVVRRGTLAEGAAELLRQLEGSRATGTLSIHTPRSSGEVRFVQGRIVDAVFGRIAGTKALARILSEREGATAFVPGGADVVPRMDGEVSPLLDALTAEQARVAALRRELDLPGDALVMAESGIDLLDAMSTSVTTRLRVPVTIDALLDEVPQADDVILGVVVHLARAGNLKRLGSATARGQVADVDTLAELKGLAARLRPAGFVSRPRVVFAAMHSRIGVVAQAASALADAVAPTTAAALPVPSVVAIVRLGDSVDLEVATLPLVPAYAPLWCAALAGAGVVVQLDDAAASLLDDTCRAVEVPLVPARELVANLEEPISPESFAALVRAALRYAAGV
jgi:hypothetical protein